MFLDCNAKYGLKTNKKDEKYLNKKLYILSDLYQSEMNFCMWTLILSAKTAIN